MAGKDLFDERSAGTWHADNEHRHAGGIAKSPPVAQQLGAKRCPDPIGPRKRLRLIVVELLPLQPIAVEQVVERLLMIAEIGKDFAEREAKPDLVLDIERFHIARELLHGSEAGVIGARRVAMARFI